MYPNMAPAGNPANAPGQGAGYSVPVNVPGPTQQGEVHPTVGNLGMPGAPMQSLPPQPQQPQYQTLPQNIPAAPNTQQPQQYAGPGTAFPQYGQPAPQAPAPQYPQNPGYTQQGQPIQQQPLQQPQQQTVQLHDNVILDGPAVPEELRGRTMGQFKQIYTALATDWLQRNPGGQPQAPQAPQPQAQPAQGQDATTDFWTDPAGYIQRTVQQAVSPMTQQAVGAQIAQARQIAMQGVPDFAQLEGEVMGLLSVIPEEARTTPQAWVNAIDLARGRMIRSGQYGRQQVQQPAQQANQYPTVQQPNVPTQYGAPPAVHGGPGSAVPASMVPLYGFYTEAPTPPAPQQAGMPSQQDQFYAQKFGMDVSTYMAWKAAQATRNG